TGAVWFIEGDIKGCFDDIDQKTMLEIIRRDVHDGRLIKLIGNLMTAGYMKDWKWHETLSGTPQGGIISPLLANIYLNELDRFVEQELLPAYNRGTRRSAHPQYTAILLRAQRLRRRGHEEPARAAYRAARQLPSQDPDDRSY